MTVVLERGRAEISCDAILFDMDGVLVDSMPIITRHLRAWAERHDLDPRLVREFSHGRTYEEMIRGLTPHIDVKLETQRCVEREATDLAGIRPCRGALELLQTLNPSSWAIVTSAYRTVANARLRAAGIVAPGVVVTADDVHRGKPHPSGYLLAAARMRVPPQRCLVIDDAPTGVQAGRAAACHVLAVGNVEATDFSMADFVVPNLLAVTVMPG